MPSPKNTAGLIRVEGDSPAEFAAALRDARKRMDRELKKSNREIGKTARDWLRAAANAGTKLERAASGAITYSGTSKGAKIQIKPGARTPMAGPAFMGTKKRTGWYARYRFRDSKTQQFPRWIGNDWTPATKGEGPYAINDELATRWPAIQDTYLDGQWAAVARAFPRGSRPRR